MSDVMELLGVFIAISSPVWIIVLIVLYMKNRARTVELRAHHSGQQQGQQQGQQVEALTAQVALLSERVKALESIVTDSGYQLQEKFRQL